PLTEIITFPSAHSLRTGDQVKYRASFGNASTVSGLNTATPYFVLVLDDQRVKLVDTLDKALHPENYFKDFVPTSVSGNAITITGHGFNTGDAVTYDAPDPKDFLLTQVDVPNSGTDNGNILLTDSPTNNNIRFAHLDGPNEGDPLDHNFSNGDKVVYTITN